MGVRSHPAPEESEILAGVNEYDDFDSIYTKKSYHRIILGDTFVRVTSGGRAMWEFEDYILVTRYSNRPLKAELKRREGISDWDTNVRLE
jgi:hypothetical protein